MRTEYIKNEGVRRAINLGEAIQKGTDSALHMLMRGDYEGAENTIGPTLETSPCDISSAIINNIADEQRERKEDVREILNSSNYLTDIVSEHYNEASFCHDLSVGAQNPIKHTLYDIKKGATYTANSPKLLAGFGYLKEGVKILLDSRGHQPWDESHWNNSLNGLLKQLTPSTKPNEIFTSQDIGYSDSLERLAD